MHRRLKAALLCSAIAIALGAPAALSAEKDWPCVQRKVAELSAGAIWSGPPLDAALNDWRDDDQTRLIVAQIVSRRTPVEDLPGIISAFAAKAADKPQTLTRVFAGAFYELNTLRSSIIRAIDRYTINQRRRSSEISDTRRAIEETGKKADAAAQLAELEQKLLWQVRIYEDRESSRLYVCEIPVLLEQRAFAISREVQNLLN